MYDLIFFTANDVLLSHMITFLNDKEDTALRGSFFDCIVGVAAYVGWHCSHILVPLLQQVIIQINPQFNRSLLVLKQRLNYSGIDGPFRIHHCKIFKSHDFSSRTWSHTKAIAV